MFEDLKSMSNEQLGNVVEMFYTCGKRNTCESCSCDGVVCGVCDIAAARENFALEVAKRLKEESYNMMPVVCIASRTSFLVQIHKGNFYQISRNSIWIDTDGDASCLVYDMQGKFVGHMPLKNFRSI